MEAMQRPNAPAWVEPPPRMPSDSDDPKTGYDTTVPPRRGPGDDKNPGEKPGDGGQGGS
jgi:hypothetical protein